MKHALTMGALTAGFALSACTTIAVGTGSGFESPGEEPVTFTWQSTGSARAGMMRATLANGQTFSGRYREGEREVSTADPDIVTRTLYDRSWVDWGPLDVPGWDGSGMMPDSFETVYSGRVAANLQSADGQRMDCSFQLNAPRQGLSGGGQGACQIENGRTVKAVFPPRRS